MSTRLHQIIAVIPDKKSKAKSVETEAYHQMQKPDLFSGLIRTYNPKDEDGEKLPPETKTLQLTCKDLIQSIRQPLIELFDTVAMQDVANCAASSNIVVNGKIVLSDVPVTHLLFLEKQLRDLLTFINKLPVLDPSEEWVWDDNRNCYVTKPTDTMRTKKVPRVLVKYEATKEHPAQVDVVQEDVFVGTWSTVKLSGAIPASVKQTIVDKANALKEAVVLARENANLADVQQITQGSTILDFVFGHKI
jgi:hypothetical protein